MITSAPFSGHQVNVKHGILRKRTFNAALKLMGQLQDICLTKEVPFDMVDIADVVCQIWTGLEGEARLDVELVTSSNSQLKGWRVRLGST